MKNLITNARTQFHPIQSPLAANGKRIEFDAELNEYACYYNNTFVCYTNTRSQAEMKLHEHAMRVLTHRRGE